MCSRQRISGESFSRSSSHRPSMLRISLRNRNTSTGICRPGGALEYPTAGLSISSLAAAGTREETPDTPRASQKDLFISLLLGCKGIPKWRDSAVVKNVNTPIYQKSKTGPKRFHTLAVCESGYALQAPNPNNTVYTNLRACRHVLVLALDAGGKGPYRRPGME